jgi:hypothetical protein
MVPRAAISQGDWAKLSGLAAEAVKAAHGIVHGKTGDAANDRPDNATDHAHDNTQSEK